MTRPFSIVALTGAALLGCAIALPAAAQFAKPEDAIKYRQAAMTMMSTHFVRVARMASGRIPFDAKAVADNAEIAAYMSKLPFAAFIDGTDKGETSAEPRIWAEKDKFNAAAKTMQDAMAKLNVAAKGSDLNAIKAAVGETDKACKACHDTYRKE
jgi:cytochrome c556